MSALTRFTRSIAPARLARQFHATRCVAANTNDVNDMQQKEDAHEKEFIARHEREALMSMIRKLESKADPNQTNAKSAAKALIEKHTGKKVDNKTMDAIVNDLLHWRSTSH